MNREVNLTKRVQTPRGWRYCTVVLSANGRVKSDLVIVNGKQETHKEGAYYLEWREGSKRVRLSVGKDPADASARRQRKEAELNAVNNGVSAEICTQAHLYRAVTIFPSSRTSSQKNATARGTSPQCGLRFEFPQVETMWSFGEKSPTLLWNHRTDNWVVSVIDRESRPSFVLATLPSALSELR